MTAPDFSETFRQEAQELLEQLEQALLDLEQSPDDHGLIDSAFRALHTIKGSGAMFGFDVVAAFTHGFETAFDRVRKGEVPASRDLIAVALAAKDHIRTLIERPHEADQAAGDIILQDLRAVVAPPAPESAPVPAAPSLADTPSDEEPVTWRLRFRLAETALVTGTNPLLLLDELRSLGPCTVVALTDGVPPLDAMEPDACYLAWDAMLTTDHPRSAIEDVFMFVIDDMDLKLERVEERKKLGEILVERGDTAPHAVEAALAVQHPVGALLVRAGEVTEDKVRSALAEQQHARSQTEAPRDTDKAGASLRVQAERLDELMDRVGELVIAQARLAQLAAAGTDLNVKAVAEELERLASGLRDITMGIRMVPIGSLFGRFRRLVHDLSRDLGKQVELTTSGEETELDKTMIERLGDLRRLRHAQGGHRARRRRPDRAAGRHPHRDPASPPCRLISARPPMPMPPSPPT